MCIRRAKRYLGWLCPKSCPLHRETLVGNLDCFPDSISMRAMDHSKELQQRASEIIPMYLKTAEQWSIWKHWSKYHCNWVKKQLQCIQKQQSSGTSESIGAKKQLQCIQKQLQLRQRRPAAAVGSERAGINVTLVISIIIISSVIMS